MFFFIVAFAIMLAGCSSGQSTDTAAPAPATPTGTAPATEATAPATTTEAATSATPASEATAPASTEKATITKSEFEQIENGMSFEEVKKIVGGEGELLAEVGKAGEEGHTIVYMYEGEGTIGANANFSFRGGILQVKSQIGLQ
ncbi:hypothetical protein ABE237_17685 [Brevibacillus formosus]|uniref:hypothetical protein n=1 Tax=Brevibacillus TaxID=55080 RepID=UPI001E592BF6|nr:MULTISPECIES: hypothetical protein [Brevibacillus]MED1948631.1 hypothetical protein [Brevibacillus formosus]MED2001648.1 hypothetical protein [Brevibacillus formosus]MED2085266.1 hypothetical protein [Brevibacillus formosus]